MRVTILSVLLAGLVVAGCVTSGTTDAPVIALIGDSTVTDEKGWGGAFANALSGRAMVQNFAVGGRSAKSYTDEKRLPAALAVLPDYVFLQFGHNGQPGKGAHRETDPDGSYRDYLRQIVAEIRVAGAEPIIVSSLTRRRFGDDGLIHSTLGPWTEGARAVAADLGVPFVDLHARSITHHNRIGPERSTLFDIEPNDHTHLNRFGANVISGLIFNALADIDHALARLRPLDVYVKGSTASTHSAIPGVESIADAIGLAPDVGNAPFHIHLDQGRYEEKLIVDKPNVHFVGAGEADTVISWADSGNSTGLDGRPVGTRGSYSVKVTAPGFSAGNLTIENAFDYEGNRALPDDDPIKVHNAQGVALMLAEGSDRARFENVTITGNQDTLFVDSGRSYFRDVRIIGHVDFIFGAGRAVFERATIEARNRPGKDPTAYITAPSTHISQPFGFLFLDCRLLRHDDVPVGSVKLGRPWHPGGNPEVSGSAVFRDCFMDDHIARDGYAPISSMVDGVRTWFDLEPDSRFFEHGSHGPGATAGPRRPRLDDEAAHYYTKENVLGDWDADGG